MQKVVRDLREFGGVQRAYLGVNIEDVANETAQELGLPNAQGVYVTRVSTDGAADEAGLKVGDVIIGINNSSTKSTPELQEIVGRFRPGEQVSLDYWRDGKKSRTQITLKDSANSSKVARYKGNEFLDDLGFELRAMTRAEQTRLGLQGAIISSVVRGSLVYSTNMQPGFILTRVNGGRVNDINEAIDAVKNAYKNIVLDGYYEGEEDLYSYRFKKR